MIEFRQVTKRYSRFVTALEGINLKFEKGEFAFVTGPSGAGKSTLLKLLANKIKPDSGERLLPEHLSVAYFAQHSVEQLDLKKTLLEEMQGAATIESSGKVRAAAKRSFSGAGRENSTHTEQRPVPLLSHENIFLM